MKKIAIVGAAFGAAGQRCMALSVAIFVGESKDWVNDLVLEAKKLKVGCGFEEGIDVGPLITPQAKERVCQILDKSGGTTILLDGREGYDDEGNFLGPTIVTGVTPQHLCYQEEIFGPVLLCMTVDTLDEAIALTNSNPYGNGCAIFTQSGSCARRFQHEIDGMSFNLSVAKYFTNRFLLTHQYMLLIFK